MPLVYDRGGVEESGRFKGDIGASVFVSVGFDLAC